VGCVSPLKSVDSPPQNRVYATRSLFQVNFMPSIQRILIANRGEIACRIARTCKRLGIDTVMVYSDADVDAMHVSAGDLAVHIGAADSLSSYLNVQKILDAARRTGADAIHPGYGFLSENAEFAQAVADAGLTFIGPPVDAIRAMGSKQNAKRLAIAAGVPVVPGYQEDDQSEERLVEEARRIGFPVLIKASAGGGGKGMQIANEEAAFLEALRSAKRVAMAAFSDDMVLLEKYITSPRHVEIQIFGDAHGKVVHLFERECSIQRRYQKIVEESPSVALTPELRERMGNSAAALGAAIGYRNAGTVEFIVSPAGDFYFLEVNTRLQVEHPVTEGVTGLDLVEHQIRVARGEPLAPSLVNAGQCGAALEIRIYAEDPGEGFMPSTGTIVDWSIPDMEGLRVDTGFATCSEVSSNYDPMLAKFITTGSDREEARLRMIQALRRTSILGVRTNREYLLRILTHEQYIAGSIHTHFLTEYPEFAAAAPPAPVQALVAAELVWLAQRSEIPTAYPKVARTGFRLFERESRISTWTVRDSAQSVVCNALPKGREFRVGDRTMQARVVGRQGVLWTLEIDGIRQTWRVVTTGQQCWVSSLDGAWELTRAPEFPEPGSQEIAGGYLAPMAGKVIAVRVSVGDHVVAGQPMIVMEAMKMEQTISARESGTVTAVQVTAGQQVDTGAVLVIIETAASVATSQPAAT
jgi:propionyl-CoA carboxylase alpha chain